MKYPRQNYSDGFTFLGLILAVSVIALLAGGGLYVREWQERQSTMQMGDEAVKKAQEVKSMIDAKNPDVSLVASPMSSPQDKIIFGDEARKFCGPEPPAICASGYALGCKRADKRWNCFPYEEKEIDTSDWKTYRNEKYRFEVRYPKEWSVKEFPDDQYVYLSPNKEKPFSGGISIYLEQGSVNESVQWLEKNSTLKIVDKDHVNLDNNEWTIMQVSNPKLDPQHKAINAFLERKKDLLHIVSDEEDVLVYQILQTFKFIE